MNAALGNLQEWDRALRWLDYARCQHTLDSHEPDLLLLLRFSGNWRLRESALNAVCELDRPSVLLENAVVEIVEDSSLYSEVRILALRALVHLLTLDNAGAAHRNEITAKLRALLDESDTPVFQKAMADALDTLESFPAAATEGMHGCAVRH